MNQPELLAKVLERLEAIQNEFNAGPGAKKVSLADVIVLAAARGLKRLRRGPDMM